MKPRKPDDGHTVQSIDSQERELKELLMRVMKEPMSPLMERVLKLEKRLEDVEVTCKDTGEMVLPSIQAEIRKNGEEVKKLKGLRDAIARELEALLTVRLASMPQDVAQLLQDQTSIRGMLDEIQRDQADQAQSLIKCGELLNKSLSELDVVEQYAKTAAEDSGKAVTCIGNSREEIGKTLDDIQNEARTESGKRGTEDAAFSEKLHCTNVLINEAVVAISHQTREQGASLVSTLNTFQQHVETSQQDHRARISQFIQQRFLWLLGICGLSFLGNLWTVVRTIL